MSTFCGGSNSGSVPAMTPDELRAVYPNGLVPLDLPTMDNGLATEDWVRNYILTLSRTGVIPDPGKASEVQSNPSGSPDTLDPLSSFVEKENTLQNNIKLEYCFYEKRYFAALNFDNSD